MIGSDGKERQLSTGTRYVYGGRGNELLVDTGGSEPDSLRWLDISSGTERAGPVRPEGLVKLAVMSSDGAWIGMLIGFNGQDVWRMRVEPPSPPERVMSLGRGMTGSALTMTTDGRALVTQGVWSGGLTVIPARTGARF